MVEARQKIHYGKDIIFTTITISAHPLTWGPKQNVSYNFVDV